MTNDKKVLQKSYIKSGLAMAFIWDVHVIQQPMPISFVEQVCPFFYHSVKGITLERSPSLKMNGTASLKLKPGSGHGTIVSRSEELPETLRRNQPSVGESCCLTLAASGSDIKSEFPLAPTCGKNTGGKTCLTDTW